jgi:hypothetical protein
MRQVLIGITSLSLLGILICKTDATPLSGSAVLHSTASSSLVVKAASCSPPNCCSAYPYLCVTICGAAWCQYCSSQSRNSKGVCPKVYP